MAALTFANRPATQLPHTVRAVVAAKVPVWQSGHACAPNPVVALAVPAAHAWHVDDRAAPISAEKRPDAHAVQTVRAVVVAYEPTVQFWHDVSFTAAAAVPILPTGHAMQAVADDVLPLSIPYRPAAQAVH